MGTCQCFTQQILLQATEMIHFNTTDMNNWISTKDKLPEKYGIYLVITDFSHNDVYDMAKFDEEGWHKASEILYWMPIPYHPDYPERTH